jgi:hypothetical protein
MLLEIIKALLLAGVPIALFSYYLVIITNTNQVLKARNSKELKKELKTRTFVKGNEENFIKQILQKKFLKFGGGFYGILTLMTYLHIEIYQVLDFMRSFTGFQDFIDSLGWHMIINFFLEAIMNMIAAFLWPIYWVKYLPIGSFWVWLIVAIVAHSMATKYALSKNSQREHVLDTDNKNN